MKKFTKILTTALAAAVAFASIPALPAIYTEDIVVASAAITPTTPTGYDSADDVQYVTAGGYTVNWGAREEECTFLTTKAQAFYGNYFDTWSKLGGNSNTSSTPTSDLYQALKSYMSSKHKNINNYDKNKETARYTDCVLNGYDKYISSFYSGKQIGPSWDGTWNREHTWPNSKGSGSAENDVMMIRPTSTSENSSRGNTAYGEGGAYYHPNSESNGTFDLRGDCARIVLYVYTRWGNTSNMWGTSGVMESKEVLLKWMKEDPVDTWEMGRNDSVQSITGTRNVFVDYPELAWLLFSEEVPTGMNTPSRIANDGVVVPPSSSGNTGGSTTPDTPTVDANNPESILKAAYALNAGEVLGTYSLTGKITNVKERDSSTKNICLTFVVDGYDEYPMYCHWLQQGYDLNVGDTITVSGEIKNYNGTIEFNKPNFTLVSSSGGTTTPDSGSGNTGSSGGSTVDPELPDDGGSTTPAGAVATFDFGAKGGSLNEGTEATSQTYTDGNYQLKITNGVKFYINARDSQGNACLKVGSSKAIGSFTFTVPSDVTSVTFHVAKYKANNSAVTINGEKFTPTGSSDDGAYEEFTVDTTTQKTVTVSTVSGSTRVMIDKIVFLAATTTPDDNTGGGTTNPDSGNTGNSSTPDSGSENNTPVQGGQADGGCASAIGGVGLGALLVCAVALLKKKRS